MLAMLSRRHSGSNSALPKRSADQVLHRGLAEVVVDAQRLVLAERRAQRRG